jgi:hypothetical protein
MMKLTIALIFASLSTTVVYAETYNYSCKVDGKTYPLRVDETKMSREWRAKQYSLTVQPDRAKYGWHAEGNGTSFDFCTATQGYAAIEDTRDGNEQVQCVRGIGKRVDVDHPGDMGAARRQITA